MNILLNDENICSNTRFYHFALIDDHYIYPYLFVNCSIILNEV